MRPLTAGTGGTFGGDGTESIVDEVGDVVPDLSSEGSVEKEDAQSIFDEVGDVAVSVVSTGDDGTVGDLGSISDEVGDPRLVSSDGLGIGVSGIDPQACDPENISGSSVATSEYTLEYSDDFDPGRSSGADPDRSPLQDPMSDIRGGVPLGSEPQEEKEDDLRVATDARPPAGSPGPSQQVQVAAFDRMKELARQTLARARKRGWDQEKGYHGSGKDGSER